MIKHKVATRLVSLLVIGFAMTGIAQATGCRRHSSLIGLR